MSTDDQTRRPVGSSARNTGQSSGSITSGQRAPRPVTLRDGPYRARSLGGAARVVVNLADHAAEIASSSVGPRHRRKVKQQNGTSTAANWNGTTDNNNTSFGSNPPNANPATRTKLKTLQTAALLQAAVTTNVDGLWQVHPSRLLEYSPQKLHTVGWFPWPSRLHLSVTVFGSKSLHAQTLVLCAWTAVIHATSGLGIAYQHQQHFKAIFGTAYLGSLASMGVIIALVLGLFISLVVQRWWEVRVQYASLHHALLELANSFATQSEYDAVSSEGSDGGATGSNPSAGTTVNAAAQTTRQTTTTTPTRSKKKTLRLVKTQLFRLLNLAHVLFLSQAGEREGSVAGARALQRGEGRHDVVMRRRDGGYFQRKGNTRDAAPRNGVGLDDSIPEEQAQLPPSPSATDVKFLDLPDVLEITVERHGDDGAPGLRSANRDEVVNDDNNSLAEDPYEKGETAADTFERGTGHDVSTDTSARKTSKDVVSTPPTEKRRTAMKPNPRFSTASTAVFADDDILSKHVTHLDHADLIALGLVTPEEWDSLTEARAAGMPRFSAVLLWASRLIHESCGHGLCSESTKNAALAKITDARLAAGRVLTYLATQLPYTYVNLVSWVVHVYLFVLSTWFGFICATGLNKLSLEGSTFDAVNAVTAVTGSVDGAVFGDVDSNGLPTASTSLKERNTSLGSDYLTLSFAYFFLVFSNVLFQGLLNIHALLDNPFGHHPGKFPLRAFVAQLVGATSALLRDKHKPPRGSPSVTVFREDCDAGSDTSGEDSSDEDA